MGFSELPGCDVKSAEQSSPCGLVSIPPGLEVPRLRVSGGCMSDANLSSRMPPALLLLSRNAGKFIRWTM